MRRNWSIDALLATLLGRKKSVAHSENATQLRSPEKALQATPLAESQEVTPALQVAEPTAPVMSTPTRPQPGVAYLELLGIGGVSVYHPIEAAVTTIGRDPTCDIVLDAALTSVSRRHAQIEHAGDAYILVDLNSSNGVFVDGVAVRRNRLRNGVEINIGRAVSFRFCDNLPGGKP